MNLPSGSVPEDAIYELLNERQRYYLAWLEKRGALAGQSVPIPCELSDARNLAERGLVVNDIAAARALSALGQRVASMCSLPTPEPPPELAELRELLQRFAEFPLHQLSKDGKRAVELLGKLTG